MHNPTEKGQPRRSFQQWFFEVVISRLISQHGKRVLFVTSLYAQLVQLNYLKAEAVDKLNVLMNLASREQALQLPTTFTDQIWSGTDLKSALGGQNLTRDVNEDLAWSLADRVVTATPMWLRYGKREAMEDTMKHDVVDLILNGRHLDGGALQAA